MMKFVLRNIGFAVLAYVSILGFYTVNQRAILYPQAVHEARNNNPAYGLSEIEVTTQDNLTLKSWYKKAEFDKSTILLFHGNGGILEGVQHQYSHFMLRGYGVLLAEYRGYGGNPGETTEEGLYKDAKAYYQWLIDNGVPADHIILYGQSLGSGVAVDLAAQKDIKALILEVPFSSTLDAAHYQLPFLCCLSILMKDQYRSDLKIGKVMAPILMGIGEKDTLVSAALGMKLFNLANEPKTVKVYEGAGHQDTYYKGFREDVLAFIESLDVKKDVKKEE